MVLNFVYSCLVFQKYHTILRFTKDRLDSPPNMQGPKVGTI